MKKLFIILFLFSGMVFAQDDYKLTAKEDVSAEGVTISVTMDIPQSIHIYTQQFFEVKDVKANGLGESKITLPESKKYKDFTGVETDVYGGKSVITVFKPPTTNYPCP